jgi:hypothetical protein
MRSVRVSVRVNESWQPKWEPIKPRGGSDCSQVTPIIGEETGGKSYEFKMEKSSIGWGEDGLLYPGYANYV